MNAISAAVKRWWSDVSLGGKQLVLLAPLLAALVLLASYWSLLAIDSSRKATTTFLNLWASSISDDLEGIIGSESRSEKITQFLRTRRFRISSDVSQPSDRTDDRPLLAIHVIKLDSILASFSQQRGQEDAWSMLFSRLEAAELPRPRRSETDSLPDLDLQSEQQDRIEFRTTSANAQTPPNSSRSFSGSGQFELWSKACKDGVQPLSLDALQSVVRSLKLDQDGQTAENFIPLKNVVVCPYVEVLDPGPVPDEVATVGQTSTLIVLSEFDPQLVPTRRSIYAAPLATAIIATLIAVFLAWLLQRIVIQPIHSLSSKVHQLAQGGNEADQVDIDRRDEIGELQSSLNALLTTIRRQDSNLREERDLLEQRVEQRTAELNRSNEDLDAFARTVSHDLQEPLRNITNIVDQLTRDWERIVDSQIRRRLEELNEVSRNASGDQAELQARLNKLFSNTADLVGEWAGRLGPLVMGHVMEITRQAKREMEMVARILEFSRIGRGFRPTRVDLNEVLQRARDSLHARLHQPDVQFECAPSLPVVLGDATLLTSVFMNLISNGLKYNDKSPKLVQVTVEPGDEPALCKIAVADNGIGILEKNRPKVFGIFVQLHKVEDYGRGIGAGLTIVKRIIERHGGTIDYESTVGQGTKFLFTLPKYSPPT